jgi:hypothetical protein
MRRQRSLNGQWQFQVDPRGALSVDTLAPNQTITVPMPWQAAHPELEHYSGYAWYRTSFAIDPDWWQGRLLLTFGAVDYWCQVYINRKCVFEHEGGYMPFTVDITEYTNVGENEIAVWVFDPAQTGLTHPRWPESLDRMVQGKPPFEPRNVPHGKQEWYVNVGGIWQDVTLTAVPHTYVQQVRITPDIHQNRAEVVITLAGMPPECGTLGLMIEGHQAELPLVAGQNSYTLSVPVTAPRLWTPDTPNLYVARVSLQQGNSSDQLDVRFGFREISTHDGALLLNGEPLFLLSALDQDLYPDTIYTVPSEDYLRDQFAKAKALGLNSLRCHIKPPDPHYLDLADEMGLLIWSEIPSWRTFSNKTTVHPESLTLDPLIKARAESILRAMIARDYNHPSLMIWTIINEDWGTSLPLSSADRAWVRDMVDLCRQLDPTRLIVDNSACVAAWGPNIHVQSDLEDFHFYANIPDQSASFVQVLEQFNRHSLWTYSSYGDSQRTGREPLILSEFGNWGMPSMHSLKAQTRQEPHWFKLGAWWSGWDGEPSWPMGVEARFIQLGLDQIWRDYETFAVATQWHQYQAMKFEIETMRRLANLKGYVITEFTDAYWESNGLLDFYRVPKAYHNHFAMINAPDVLIPQLRRHAFWDDEKAIVRLFGSHFSAQSWEQARLHWLIGAEHGELDIEAVPRGGVANFGLQQLPLAAIGQAQTVTLQLQLDASDGTTLARNQTEVLVLPRAAAQASYQGDVFVSIFEESGHLPVTDTAPDMTDLSALETAPHSDHKQSEAAVPQPQQRVGYFKRSLAQLGYHVTQTLPARGIVITNYPSQAMLDWVRGGGDMLYLSESIGPFFWRQSRSGIFGGSWITSFSWLRPGVYQRVPVANPLQMPFANIMPTGVILGIPMDDPSLQPDFLAGQVTGWLRHAALHTVQFCYGKGRVIMTTFALRNAFEKNDQDPLAIAMLHDLIDQLIVCQPVLTANF